MASVDEDVEIEKQESTEYIGPRRKRKNYAVFAVGEKFDGELVGVIESFLRDNYGSLTVTRAKDVKEFARFLNRKVGLLILDDTFQGVEDNMKLVRQMKEKKVDTPVPVLFLTENPDELIRMYNQYLLPFQEVDNYVSYKGMAKSKLISGVRATLEGQVARRSRRFSVDVPITVSNIGGDSKQGTMVDLSVHGSIIVVEDHLFREKEQVRIRVPVSHYLSPKHGEFVKVSGKVRRVFMGGNKAAVSWENMNESQVNTMTDYVIGYFNKNFK